MKNIMTMATIIMLILAAMIIYLEMQRESIFNPPNITGVGFIVLAAVFALWRKHV